ncbi:MAG: cation:proton antiporter [Shimia sp.]
MSDLLPTLDARDVVYLTLGAMLFVMTLQPALEHRRLANLPLLMVVVGLALGTLGLPIPSPLASELQASVIEHASELIVIISLAGAGLAIDTRMAWRSWQPAFRLVAVGMPLTIAAIWAGAHWGLGLSAAGAMLLAAGLAPTDPVLARAVQVGPPGEDETPMQVALTAEAGLNDGLAFPFVYLAIAFAGPMSGGWLVEWASFDLLYRVIAGLVVGFGTGHVVSRLTYAEGGDAAQGGWNAVVLVLAATFIAYGLAEAVDGYGFLAVFFAARAGRSHSGEEDYARFTHHGADQLETILLVVLLVWFGAFLASGALAGLTWAEVGFALALLLVVRPIVGILSLVGYDCPGFERRQVAFFGIRGMGSVFYIAYGQTHADFVDIDAVWRIAAVTILASIVIHGFAAKMMLPAEEDDSEARHPKADGADGADAG